MPIGFGPNFRRPLRHFLRRAVHIDKIHDLNGVKAKLLRLGDALHGGQRAAADRFKKAVQAY